MVAQEDHERAARCTQDLNPLVAIQPSAHHGLRNGPVFEMAGAAKRRWRLDLVLCVVRAGGLRAGLVDDRAIAWFWDGFLFSARRREPGWFRDFRLFECFGGSVSERRTDVEVGNIGDVSSVWLAVEGIDMVVFHGTSTTFLSTCRCSASLLLFFLQPLGDP